MHEKVVSEYVLFQNVNLNFVIADLMKIEYIDSVLGVFC